MTSCYERSFSVKMARSFFIGLSGNKTDRSINSEKKHRNINYKEINAESQINDENSIFNYTKNLISLRKNHSAFINGDIEFIFEEHNKIFSYIRKNDEEKILVICNFYGENEKITLENIIIKDVKKIFGNYDSFDIINNEIVVRPYEAMVLLI